MGKVIKVLINKGGVLLLTLSLLVLPVGATVPGDIAAGLPLSKVITNGLGAGLTIEAIISQALAAGAQPKALFQAALTLGFELSRLFRIFLEQCLAAHQLSKICNPCVLMKWAVEAGKDMLEVANAMMAAGTKIDQVRICLANMGYPEAETYVYGPPAPPTYPLAIGPSFLGGGGGGIASPAQ